MSLLLPAATTPAADVADVARAELRDSLLARLRVQRAIALPLFAWYEGEQPSPSQPVDPSLGHFAAFNRLREMARGAWARLVVDTIAERLEVQGVRTTSGEESDRAAWQLLQQSHVDADQRDVYVEAFIAGRSYVSVSADDSGVRITPETLLEVTHAHAPGNRRLVTAALKLFPLAGGRLWVAEVYTPTERVVWMAEYADARRTPLADNARAPWDETPTVSSNPLGVVPFVPFLNRPTTATPGESELRELTPIMERIQELELAKLVAAHTAVFRQKWATGLVVPRDPETGKPVEPYTAALDRLWVSEAPDTKFGSFDATEIGQYLNAINAEIAELASVSRVPSYYLMQAQLVNPPSAESLIASEAGLVAKCVDRMRGFGESWEQVVRMAARAGGDDRLANDRALEVLWRSPERRNPAVVADAATKLQAIGVPWSELMAFVGYSPQAVDRMRVDRAAEALTSSVFSGQPAAA